MISNVEMGFITLRVRTTHSDFALCLHCFFRHHICKDSWLEAQCYSEQLSEIEADVNLIRSNYEVRGKVLGQADAEERFNEALTKYLLGDYKGCQKPFMFCWRLNLYMVLDFIQEAEWYLVDSAFKIGQYALVKRFAKQISNNPGHMFFTDAIRLLLESHGRRGRSDKFREDYRRFVLSGYVESSDALNYAIGKSFYFQGDTPQAKQALFEIQNGSLFWHRAQYFLGGIYVLRRTWRKLVSRLRWLSILML